MELHHNFTVPSSVDDTWATFNDLELVAPCFPGATLTGVDGDEFTGTVKVKLGPISMVYSGSGKFTERDEGAHRAVIEASGKDKRGNGNAGATVTVQLAPDGDGTTVDVLTDMNVGGKPAQFGRGIIQSVSNKLMGKFVDCVKTKLPT
ncbi:SRPBCC family protein [Spelaeicoccus albus]|uniref:Carbon monoxide dehydrogenase subunit G n=1 Tax=Spelaeicoccus albus TaxID=1280376 RepID=A0A7Z0A7H4_9MICO|nr:SRPBCC family protein [Spelaeicoccus albus]NYI65822.1 carbon monoxide dehydrogenase subunit G [Spelaeicoccus albus]